MTTIAEWLAEQEAAARGRASDQRLGSDKEHWHRAQAAAYEAAHAYAVTRPDRADETAAIRAMLMAGQGDDDGVQILPDMTEGMSTFAMVSSCVSLLEKRRDIVEAPHEPSRPTRLPMVPDIADADLTYLAGLAISSKDAALARIAAALLLAR